MSDALTAVVLAGGRSRRFGDDDKLLAPVPDRPLLAHVVETVRGVSDATPVVATRDRSHERSLVDAVPGNVRFVHDEADFEGPLAGIAAATRVVETPWLFVCGGDMPRISGAAVAALRDREGGGAAVPIVDGLPEPLHAVYRRKSLETALRRVRPDAGVRALLAILDPIERVRPVETSAPLAGSTSDVDTKADLVEVCHG